MKHDYAEYRNVFLRVVLRGIFIVFFLCAFHANASASVDIKDVHVFSTHKTDMSLEELEKLHQDDFYPIQQEIIRFWNVRNVLWVRLSAPNLKELRDRAEINMPAIVMHSEYIVKADLYIPLSFGAYRHLIHGLDVPVERRSYPSRLPSFSLQGLDSKGYVYLKVETNFPIGFNLTLEEERPFFLSFIGRLGQYMAFYAFLFSLMLLYLFFYSMTGSISYFIVGVRQLGVLLFILALSGYLQYYFNVPSQLVYIINWLGIGIYVMGSSLLLKKLLPSLDSWPHKVLNVYQSLVAICIVGSMLLGNVYLGLFVMVLVLSMEIITVLFSALLFLRNRALTEFLFLISRVAFIAGLSFLFVDMLTRSEELNVYMFFVALLLDPLLIVYLLLPGSRNRFKGYLLLEERNAYYKQLSQIDRMTGLYNKARMMEILHEKITVANETHLQLAFLMIDIDDFKKFNDTWGHLEGDKALIFLAQKIRNCLRENDEAARYGGEEFSVILPGASTSTALLVAERIRKICEVESQSLGEGKSFTLSIGVAMLQPADQEEFLIERADKALYLAKAKGRNRTELSGY